MVHIHNIFVMKTRFMTKRQVVQDYYKNLNLVEKEQGLPFKGSWRLFTVLHFTPHHREHFHNMTRGSQHHLHVVFDMQGQTTQPFTIPFSLRHLDSGIGPEAFRAGLRASTSAGR